MTLSFELDVDSVRMNQHAEYFHSFKVVFGSLVLTLHLQLSGDEQWRNCRVHWCAERSDGLWNWLVPRGCSEGQLRRWIRGERERGLHSLVFTHCDPAERRGADQWPEALLHCGASTISWGTDVIYRDTHKAILQPFQPTPSVKNWRILLEQSLTAHMPLLTAASAFGLGRRC